MHFDFETNDQRIDSGSLTHWALLSIVSIIEHFAVILSRIVMEQIISKDDLFWEQYDVATARFCHVQTGRSIA